MKLEVRPFGIRVVVIRPGDFHTGFTKGRRKLHPVEGSPYGKPFATALRIMENDEMSGPSPDPIARLLEHIITTRSPRFSYTVGSATQRFLIGTRHVLPWPVFERMIRMYYRLA